MYHQIPNDEAELMEKLAWEHEHGNPTLTKEQLLIKTALDGVDFLLEDALEGPYWAAKWLDVDRKIQVIDVMKQPVGVIEPKRATFSEDFLANAPRFWQHMTREVQRIIGHE